MRSEANKIPQNVVLYCALEFRARIRYKIEMKNVYFDVEI